MNKLFKIALAIVALILTIHFASALPKLEITPSPFSITVNQGEEKQYNLTLKNTGNETMYNVTFSKVSGLDFPKIKNMTANETKKIKMTIKTNSAFSRTDTTKASFYYKRRTDSGQKTKKVNITSTGFYPDNVTIKQGDIVQWKNLDNKNHTITDLNGGFDLKIAPSQTKELTINSAKEYYDRVTGYGAYVSIGETTNYEYIHSNNLDKTLQIVWKSNFVSADIDLFQVTPDSFVMDFDDTDTGTIILRSTKEIYNVELEADWFKFDKNDFNMSKNTNKIINFELDPEISDTEDTNRTYTRQITVRADNLDTTRFSVDIFIRYHNFELYGDGSYNIVTLDYNETIKICTNNKTTNQLYDSAGCIYLREQIAKTLPEKVKLIEKNWTNAWTESELKELFDINKTINKRLERLENDVVSQNENLEEYLIQMEGFKKNQTILAEEHNNNFRIAVEKIKEINDSMRSSKDFWRGLAIMIIITFLGMVGFIFYNNYYARKEGEI